MSRPAPLVAAADPVAIYQTSLPAGAASAEWYTLTDAKVYLNIPLDDTSDDARLQLSLTEGLGFLQKTTGRSLKDEARVAEYACRWSTSSVLRVPALGATVTSVERVGSDGVATTVASTDYVVVYDAGEPHVRLNSGVDDIEADYDGGVVARVNFMTTISKDSAEAQVARGVMNEWMSHTFYGKDGDPRQGGHVRRALNILRDMGGVGPQLTQ